MPISKLPFKGRMPMAAAAIAALLGASGPALAAAQRELPGELGGLSFTNSEPTPRVHVAQAQDAAQLMVRIQQMEEQIRMLNGQVEGLTFQLTQMQELVNRSTEQTASRLQALEGGAPAATAPAAGPAPADEAAPPTEIPAQGVRPLPGEAEFDPTFTEGAAPELGQSGDPLVGTGSAGGVDLATGQPIDLNYHPANANSGNPDADAQFAAGYQAIVSGDYAFAEDQFSQFLELYPDSPQAADAASLLGDALLQRNAYNEAADVLLKAYQDEPGGPRAPELLIKLGASMMSAGEQEVACRTYGQVDANYPDLTPELAQRLQAEKTRAQCPPA